MTKSTTDPVSFRPRQLHPHQEDGVRFLLDHPRAVLADDVGLGKTITAAEYIRRLNTRSVHPDSPAVVWVTDATLIPQTVEELTRHLPSFRVTSTNHAGFASKPTRKGQAAFADEFGAGVDALVTSYQWVNSRRDQEAAAWHPRLVVLDEVMAIKGTSHMWSAITAVTGRSDRCVALTATPLENDPMETYAVLDALGTPGLWPRGLFERDFVAWREPYEVSPGQWTDRQPVAFLPGVVEPFRHYLSGFMLRRTAGQVGLALPTIARETVMVSLSPAQQRAYDAAKKRAGLRGHQLRQKAALSTAGESVLVDECVRLLSTTYTAGKVVVYAENLGMLDLLEDAFTRAGISHVRIEGSVKPRDRESALGDFRTTNGPRVLFGSKVLERGLNLQVSSVLISLDSTYNPAREIQREGRIRRIGSPHDVVKHVTLLPQTPDALRKMDTLSRKLRTAAAVLSPTGIAA